MISFMKFKKIYIIISLLIILPGLFFVFKHGLKMGIDFTGGALLEYQFKESVNLEELRSYGTITPSENNTFIIRTKPLSHDKLLALRTELRKEFGEFIVRREETVGPVIGEELKQKSLIAITLACLMIVLYITFSFRKVPKPASSFRFGVSAIVSLIHDVLVLVGIFAILGVLINVEIDTLFVTAVLTVIGFSVHDTIVVFDRIRENLPKNLGKKFQDVADISITQTIGRSLTTSMTILFVLLALLLFGGDSIKWFVVALLIGIISGTYSSIFNATAVLTWWEEKLGH